MYTLRKRANRLLKIRGIYYRLPSHKKRVKKLRLRNHYAVVLSGILIVTSLTVSTALSSSNLHSKSPSLPHHHNPITKHNHPAKHATPNTKTVIVVKLAPTKLSPATTPPPTSSQPFLFGMGAQLGGVVSERLYREAPIKLLTSWYNNPSDLEFMSGWKSTLVPQAYASGHSLHLIVWTGDEERNIDTKYGPACGRAYPFSASFEKDMKQLADTFSGKGTLYVSMFTEFQTYPCHDNQWQGNENYFRALQDQYRVAQQIFKTNAPNAKMSLTWGGWQTAWDDKEKGGGKSLFPHFADIMNGSDFQSFQAMDSNSNVQSIINMTHQLHTYGKGASSDVMLAHYKPDNGSQVTWHNDLERIFVPTVMSELQQNGLFAFSFMDEKNINASEAAYQQARQIVNNYAR